jgi:thioredoxin reductase (NADPH)
MNQSFHNDVAIIGAGPAGLFAVFQCGMLGLKCDVIDSLEGIGGQCTALYPEKPIYDIPGFPAIDAAQLIAGLEQQAAPFSPRYHLAQTVNGLQKDGEGWRLETSRGTIIHARAVIIAAGGGCFGPNRPPLEGLEEYEGTSVFYMVRRKQDFAGKNVVIAGGGDSAVDWALSLADVAKSIKVVHRRDKFRAAPESLARMHTLAGTGALELVVPYQLKALNGSNGHIRSIEVISSDNDVRHLDADVLLPFFGLSASLGPIADWNLDLQKDFIRIDPLTAETSVPGIYAIGDIVAYDKKLKLILTGFAEAAQASHAIYERLNPGQALHFEYSTTKGIPGMMAATLNTKGTT